MPSITSTSWTGQKLRFLPEARPAAGIEHPNFCPVHDVDVIDGLHFFTTAYLGGTSLAALSGGEQPRPPPAAGHISPLAARIADEQPWPQQQAVEMVRLLALAVGQLQSRGIIHRDLKPANVMVRATGEPVLMDFGLACSLTLDSERLTATGEVMGSLA